MRSLYVGIHLPVTADAACVLAALDDDGALVERATAATDDDIAAWLDALPGAVAVAAVDAPLVPAAGVGEGPRAGVLAARLGWTTTATNRGSTAWPACLRVDPHRVVALPEHLRAVDDDAVRCAHLAWVWHERPGTLRVEGDRDLDYVVAPPPPPHPAGTALRVEADPEEIDTVRAAIEAIPGVRAVLLVAPDRARAEDGV